MREKITGIARRGTYVCARINLFGRTWNSSWSDDEEYCAELHDCLCIYFAKQRRSKLKNDDLNYHVVSDTLDLFDEAMLAECHRLEAEIKKALGVSELPVLCPDDLDVSYVGVRRNEELRHRFDAVIKLWGLPFPVGTVDSALMAAYLYDMAAIRFWNVHPPRRRGRRVQSGEVVDIICQRGFPLNFHAPDIRGDAPRFDSMLSEHQVAELTKAVDAMEAFLIGSVLDGKPLPNWRTKTNLVNQPKPSRLVLYCPETVKLISRLKGAHAQELSSLSAQLRYTEFICQDKDKLIGVLKAQVAELEAKLSCAVKLDTRS